MALAFSCLLSGTLVRQRQALPTTAGCPREGSPLPQGGPQCPLCCLPVVWNLENPLPHERWLSSDMLQRSKYETDPTVEGRCWLSETVGTRRAGAHLACGSTPEREQPQLWRLQLKLQSSALKPSPLSIACLLDPLLLLRTLGPHFYMPLP